MLLRRLVSTWVLLSAIVTVFAQDKVAIDQISLTRDADSVQLVMRIDLRRQQIEKDVVLLLMPRIVEGNDSVNLPSVGIYGRNPYYYHVRSGYHQLQGDKDVKIRAKDRPDEVVYSAILPYQQWMDKASAFVEIQDIRKCDNIVGEEYRTVIGPQVQVIHTDDRLYTETGTVSGRAYIDFVVNTTELRPDYHHNQTELEKIRNTIDSIRYGENARITGITIKGYASPEGPYKKNVRLAKGRSERLTRYLIEEYGIDDKLIQTEYEPEDWEGLRRYVAESFLPHREQILDIIDTSTEDPDSKLRRIEKSYPDDYYDILINGMPYLRHSDYHVDYEKTVNHWIAGINDSIYGLPQAQPIDVGAMPKSFKTYEPLFALKTNLLFDAIMAPNIEIEIPFGKDRKWSVMIEDWFPWWLFNRNAKQGSNPYRLLGVPYYSTEAKGYQDAYEVWLIGAELRRWIGKCPTQRPALTGTFWGVYVAGGKSDIERKSQGNQGEFVSIGATIGHSWLLSRHWNLELSGSIGVLFGPRRHYHGEFDDTHLIWQFSDNIFYAGPTKLKLSLVYVFNNFFKKKKKGGER
jgi:outer membrane protein OmpA-like peptidoglycan-associated protein